MNKETFAQYETDDDIDSLNVNNVRNLTYSRMLMVLTLIGASFVSGCSPKLTKAPQSICSATFKKCSRCLNDLMEQKLADYDCLKQEVDILAKRNKPPRKLCKLRHPRSIYQISHCDSVCKGLQEKTEKCTFKVTRFRLKVLEKVKGKLKCLITEHNKKKRGTKYSFKKCETEINEAPKSLRDECEKK